MGISPLCRCLIRVYSAHDGMKETSWNPLVFKAGSAISLLLLAAGANSIRLGQANQTLSNAVKIFEIMVDLVKNGRFFLHAVMRFLLESGMGPMPSL